MRDTPARHEPLALEAPRDGASMISRRLGYDAAARAAQRRAGLRWCLGDRVRSLTERWLEKPAGQVGQAVLSMSPGGPS
jgi:hypothetical protein